MRAGAPTDVSERLNARDRVNRAPLLADEILRKACAYFTQAEICRQFKPGLQSSAITGTLEDRGDLPRVPIVPPSYPIISPSSAIRSGSRRAPSVGRRAHAGFVLDALERSLYAQQPCGTAGLSITRIGACKADSNGRRNTECFHSWQPLVKRLSRRFPAQRLSRTGIEYRCHGGDLVSAVDAQVGAFREVLT